ncbi:TIGR03936 family radical SAM-associated protein [Clostridium brassicae]|uniref:TIGR03936 family radical SAM-associated protein n=1 Tax=Clostridium brassicae TaxID=2999072 RepID=A0ABT4DBQ2_9CLOT|nr:TIGR03936 family radical SAM-associated protein [Clostridium brassicae]MCY6959742.1 TIGR03936 family radical SAM-associated protein [Clostridium brassicae]
MRYLIKFTKEGNIKFVGHLDLMRTIQRMIRRSEIPVQYSKGFNPHIILSIAQPLSVGAYSRGEYMDLEFTEEIDTEYIKERLNENAPMGIKILNVVKAKEKIGEKKAAPAMALIEAAQYNIKIKCIDSETVQKDLKAIMTREEWIATKTSKKGSKDVNIKPMIKKINCDIDDSFLFINTTLTSGSKENLSAQLLGEYLRDNLNGVNKEAFIDIERQDMYAYEGKKMLSLDEYLKE